jgi:hypothetical protein
MTPGIALKTAAAALHAGFIWRSGQDSTSCLDLPL